MADEEEGEAEGDGDDEDGMAVSWDGETVWYSVNDREGSPRKLSEGNVSRTAARTNAVSPDFPALWEKMCRASFHRYESYLGWRGIPWNGPIITRYGTKARRIGKLRYAAYASGAMRQVRSLPWISYEDSMGHLPHARWMEQAAADNRQRRSALRVHDAETALEGVAAGLGKSLLPTAVADKDRRLRRIELETARPVPSRELWLLVHADQYRLPRIAAVIAWLEKVVQELELH